MNKLLVGFLACLACVLLLGALLVVLFALMDAISLDAQNMWRAVFSLPLAAAGTRLYVLLDRECDKR